MAINGIKMITDRSLSDVEYVKTLLRKGYQNMTDEERQNFLIGLKGAYNYTDFNRIESVVGYLAEILSEIAEEVTNYADELGVFWDENAFGFYYNKEDAQNIQVKTDWKYWDIITEADRKRYIDNIQTIIKAFVIDRSDVPLSLKGIDYKGANAIERCLENIDENAPFEKERIKKLIESTAKSWYYSGEIYGGET